MPDYKLRRELAAWREDFTVAAARAQAGGVLTVAELAVGGCLSALSSIRCGFKHIWTTETDEHKAGLAELLTRAPCIGDTFAHDYKQLRARYGHVSYLKAGQPCTDYSSLVPTRDGVKEAAPDGCTLLKGSAYWIFNPMWFALNKWHTL